MIAGRPGAGPADGAGIERVVVDARPARAELPEPDGQVGRDQRIGNEREPARRDVVEERQHYAASSRSRNRPSAANIRLLTVPSGTPSRSASSDWVSPP